MMYVPAYELEPLAFKDMAMRMTASPPAYQAAKLEPGVRRAPAMLTSDQLQHLAEFLFVTGVAEKPGVLQRLSYHLAIKAKALLYLPYYKVGDSYKPGY